MALTASQQLSLYARVLPFDRHLMEQAGDEVVIGIVYQSGFPESRRAKEAILEAVDQTLVEIAQVPTRFIAVDVPTAAALGDALERHQPDVLYVAPLRSIAIGAVREMCERHQVASITGVPDYVDRGVAVGIGERGGKPEILVNKDVADALGMDFAARFLRLVTVR